MRTEKLRAVTVSMGETYNEHFEVGLGDVTSIEWGTINGHMAHLDTVRVFVNGKLSSEHPFCNCLSVFFVPQEGE
ncbi:hypothetical protein HBA54_19220 [Pelagibius litoralis]|uniref:Uncharacterized protein n=1 Tax=Pelagibius litoralis TaxID=374515 RepID=A0A967F0D1_9PROT|nr:hypothetical protein [Pelagibius litoralis]NIA70734.1 hypothetical protein [Pelagibius litoralis]